MTLTDDDMKYLIKLNMEAGLSFEDAALSSGASDPLTVSRLKLDTSWLERLPAPLPLVDLMQKVLACIGEGADLDTALVVEEATPEQAALLRGNPGFLSRVQRIEAIARLQDRSRLEQVIEANLERGISTELRWRMSALDQLYRPKTLSVSVSNEIPEPEIVDG